MLSSQPARITGLGAYLPKSRLSNEDLEKMVDTTDDWIFSRTGIKERRIASKEETTALMGALAAKKALIDAKLDIQDIDLILVATMTPDFLCPGASSFIQRELGGVETPCFDLQAACSGFLFGLSVAKGFVESGMYRHILLIATEKMSSLLDYEDRNTCILFGDGAAACVISGKGEGLLIGSVHLGSEGKGAELIWIPEGGSQVPLTEEALKKKTNKIQMNGREVFKNAVKRLSESAKIILEKEHLKPEDIRFVVPHQANRRILEATAKACLLSLDRIYQNLHNYGNTASAGVAIALTELCEKEVLLRGDRLLLMVFGAGFNWGSVCLTKVND